MPTLGSDESRQDFFLGLARRGRETWNEWRRKNTTDLVTFEGVDFRYSANRGIDFSGFIFGPTPNFRRARFGDGPDHLTYDLVPGFRPGMAKFTGATFGPGADFSGLIAGQTADFTLATFEGSADFADASFGEGASFDGTYFGGAADFAAATFGNLATFSAATFDGITRFVEATFGERANFKGATFDHITNFSSAIFLGSSSFQAMTEEEWLRFVSKITQSWDAERKTAFILRHQAAQHELRGPAFFVIINFFYTRFDGVAEFSGRTVIDTCDFAGTEFNEVPVFDNCEGVNRINFYGAKVQFSGQLRSRSIFGRKLDVSTPGWTTHSIIALRLRALRQFAEETKNHDLERDLYIEERKAERGILLARYFREKRKPSMWPRLMAHSLWIVIMGAYWLMSDYGRSIIRPLVAFGISICLFTIAYSSTFAPLANVNRAEFTRAVGIYAIANAFPFVGASTLDRETKELLFCGISREHQPLSAANVNRCVAILTPAIQLLTIGQSFISTILLFFAALALRNYFKVR